MPLHLLTQTSSTSTPDAAECVVYWQNCPKLAPGRIKPKLIDATGKLLPELYPLVASSASIVLHGIDLLIPLKLAPVAQINTFIRALSEDRLVTVVLNSDDPLRQGEQAFLLQTLAHAAHQVTALRALPSGRDREFAGMARFTPGAMRAGTDLPEVKQGERLFRYGEAMQSATL